MDKKTLERIAHLAIPPAWTEVKIAHDPRAHLQVTGKDQRGRTQYRYHPLWRTVRDLTKFHRMIPFGEALPALRSRIAEDLKKPALSRENILALVVTLLDRTLIRVGNEEYAEDNHSYGLTTMLDHHAHVHGSTVKFRFRGKSGKMHTVMLSDKRLAKIIHLSQDLPGQQLFQYEDEKGTAHDISSTDVNEYLKSITGEHFTAKDFRTWAATVSAALCLSGFGDTQSKTDVKKNIVNAIIEVSGLLGNTPAVCRKSYVHPLVLQNYECHLLGSSLQLYQLRLKGHSIRGLSLGEAAVLEFLKACERKSAR